MILGPVWLPGFEGHPSNGFATSMDFGLNPQSELHFPLNPPIPPLAICCSIRHRQQGPPLPLHGGDVAEDVQPGPAGLFCGVL